MSARLLRAGVAGMAIVLLLDGSATDGRGFAKAADWLQFRGTNLDGVAVDATPPAALNTVSWKAELPGRGVSGPIVIGDRVVVTCSSGYRQDRLHVLCFGDATGTLLWERQFWATGRTQTHQKTCVAAPTPASDGQRIFALYSSNDLACLDLDGKLLWYRGLGLDFPNANNSLGMASSPVVVGDTLIVQLESDAQSAATGLDVQTGRHRWIIERPRKANWTSPTVLRGQQPDDVLVLLQSWQGVTAVKPHTGVIAWSYGDGASTISSSVVADNLVIVPSHGLTALIPPPHCVPGESPGAKGAGGEDKVGESPAVRWQVGRLSPHTISPLVYEGRVYTINGAGVLSCAETETGELRWQIRLTGPFSSSPIAAGGHVYCVNEAGLVQVVRPDDPRGRVVGRMDLGETILCTPAIAGDGLYIRSDEHLWKLAH